MADNHDGDYQYPLDTTGRKPSNLVTGERQTINPGGFMDYYVLIPKATPFYREGFKIRRYPSGEELLPGVHYGFSHLFMSALDSIGVGVYGSITFYDHTLQGSVELEYQTLGGSWTISEQQIANILANIIVDPRITSWEQITGMPEVFPPIDHEHDIDDFFGADDIVEVLERIRLILENSSDSALQAHIADKENPHQTTKTHVGLGLVQNFAIASEAEANGARNDLYMTPLRTRQALQLFVLPLLEAHTNNTNNPHQTTKAHVGLNLVENYGIATRPQAEQGTRNDLYMTPLMSGFQITAMALVPLGLHIDDTNNPHGTTKAHVGLSLVENLGLADLQTAQAGESNGAYMTPLRTAQLVDALFLPLIRNHINDKENPHETTKAHVGLSQVPNWPAATQPQAAQGTDNASFMTPLRTAQAMLAGQAGDALKVFGRDESQTQQWIETFTVANANRVFNLTLPQLTSQILSGTAANANAINGRTWSDIENLIATGEAGGNSQSHLIPPIYDDGSEDEIFADESWTLFGSMLVDLPSYKTYTEDLVLLISGGSATPGEEVPVQRATFTIKSQFDLNGVRISVLNGVIESLNRLDGPEIGYRLGQDVETEADIIEFWLKDPSGRSAVSFLLESKSDFNWIDPLPNTSLDDLIVVQPDNLLYATRFDNGPNPADLQYTLVQGFDEMTAAINAI